MHLIQLPFVWCYYKILAHEVPVLSINLWLFGCFSKSSMNNTEPKWISEQIKRYELWIRGLERLKLKKAQGGCSHRAPHILFERWIDWQVNWQMISVDGFIKYRPQTHRHSFARLFRLTGLLSRLSQPIKPKTCQLYGCMCVFCVCVFIGWEPAGNEWSFPGWMNFDPLPTPLNASWFWHRQNRTGV